MKKLNIYFKLCYGIKSLTHQFDFSNRTFAIYAPNGVMKTSFARTFDDLATGSETKDLAFPDRVTVPSIIADDEQLPKENVFVVQSYSPNFKSEKMSTLLANQKLKAEYEKTHKEINNALSAIKEGYTSYTSLGYRRLIMLLRFMQSFVLNSVLAALILTCFMPAKDTYAGSRASSNIDQGSVSYSYNMVQRAQRMLIELGYNPGPKDGIWGPLTSGAVMKYQEDNSLKKSGKLDNETKKQLFSNN